MRSRCWLLAAATGALLLIVAQPIKQRTRLLVALDGGNIVIGLVVLHVRLVALHERALL